MSTSPKWVPDRRHKGPLRTERRKNYARKLIKCAAGDPVVGNHTRLLGKLFQERILSRTQGPQMLDRMFRKCDPYTGRLLRDRRTSTKRQTKHGNLLSNEVFGLDVVLGHDVSISVAALVLGDDAVADAALKASVSGFKYLCNFAGYRVRRDGAKHAERNGLAAVVTGPEKANREGEPHLHMHGIFPNITMEELADEGRRPLAMDFGEIISHAPQARELTQKRLRTTLAKRGYQVELVNGYCRLPSVPLDLCGLCRRKTDEYESTHRPKWEEAAYDTRFELRDNIRVMNRPPKELLSTEIWRERWSNELGVENLRNWKEEYYNSRMMEPAQVVATTVVEDVSANSICAQEMTQPDGNTESDRVKPPLTGADETVPCDADQVSPPASPVAGVHDLYRDAAERHVAEEVTHVQSAEDDTETAAGDGIHDDPRKMIWGTIEDMRSRYDDEVEANDRRVSPEIECEIPELPESRAISHHALLRAMLRLALRRGCLVHVRTNRHEYFPQFSAKNLSATTTKAVHLIGTLAHYCIADLPADAITPALVDSLNQEWMTQMQPGPRAPAVRTDLPPIPAVYSSALSSPAIEPHNYISIRAPVVSSREQPESSLVGIHHNFPGDSSGPSLRIAQPSGDSSAVELARRSAKALLDSTSEPISEEVEGPGI